MPVAVKPLKRGHKAVKRLHHHAWHVASLQSLSGAGGTVIEPAACGFGDPGNLSVAVSIDLCRSARPAFVPAFVRSRPTLSTRFVVSFVVIALVARPSATFHQLLARGRWLRYPVSDLTQLQRQWPSRPQHVPVSCDVGDEGGIPLTHAAGGEHHLDLATRPQMAIIRPTQEAKQHLPVA